MDENEKKEPETAQEPPKPEDYGRYMGTLNRIYRRNNNPQRKKLGDGITSLKKGQQPAAPAPEPGKKDRSFLVVAGGAILLLAILYFIKLLGEHQKMPLCSVELHGGIFYNTMLRRSRSGTSPQPQWQRPRPRPRR